MAGSHRYCLIRPSDNVTRQASLELSGGAAEDFSLNFRPRLPVSVSPRRRSWAQQSSSSSALFAPPAVVNLLTAVVLLFAV